MSLGVTVGTLLIQVFEPLLNPKIMLLVSLIRYMSCCCRATFKVHAAIANARTGQVGQ